MTSHQAQLPAHKGLRGDILVALKREQPLTARDLAQRLGVSPNAIRHHLKELETSAAAARDGARAVLHSHESEVASVAVDDPAVIDQVNTPEDYERLVREWNRDIY